MTFTPAEKIAALRRVVWNESSKLSDIPALWAILADLEAGEQGWRPIAELVDRFLMWPLPQSVCSDGCVTDPNYRFPRAGTNLLTAEEARQMIEYLLAQPPAESREDR